MKYDALIFGSSTGGPKALREILSNLKTSIKVPCIISQSLPAGLFAESLADGLKDATGINVKVLTDKDNFSDNIVRIIPGGFNISLKDKDVFLVKENTSSISSPNITNTLNEFSEKYRGKILVVILTGICTSNVIPSEALERIRNNDGFVIVQSPETAFISDLPERIIKSKQYDKIVALEDIAKELNAIFS